MIRTTVKEHIMCKNVIRSYIYLFQNHNGLNGSIDFDDLGAIQIRYGRVIVEQKPFFFKGLSLLHPILGPDFKFDIDDLNDMETIFKSV